MWPNANAAADAICPIPEESFKLFTYNLVIL